MNCDVCHVANDTVRPCDMAGVKQICRDCEVLVTRFIEAAAALASRGAPGKAAPRPVYTSILDLSAPYPRPIPAVTQATAVAAPAPVPVPDPVPAAAPKVYDRIPVYEGSSGPMCKCGCIMNRVGTCFQCPNCFAIGGCGG